jgi:hypothetical protein
MLVGFGMLLNQQLDLEPQLRLVACQHHQQLELVVVEVRY